MSADTTVVILETRSPVDNQPEYRVKMVQNAEMLTYQGSASEAPGPNVTYLLYYFAGCVVHRELWVAQAEAEQIEEEAGCMCEYGIDHVTELADQPFPDAQSIVAEQSLARS